MSISKASIKELRDQCGAGVMDCHNALLEADGDMEKALDTLKEKGFLKAAKKAERVTKQGLVEAYVHAGGRIGAMVELNCETDFVARTDEFKELAHNIAMQVAAMCPRFISEDEIPEGQEAEATISPGRHFDVGAGVGKRLETTLTGGVVGLVIDGRGRPLTPPEDANERNRKLKEWIVALDLYPEDYLKKLG